MFQSSTASRCPACLGSLGPPVRRICQTPWHMHPFVADKKNSFWPFLRTLVIAAKCSFSVSLTCPFIQLHFFEFAMCSTQYFSALSAVALSMILFRVSSVHYAVFFMGDTRLPFFPIVSLSTLGTFSNSSTWPLGITCNLLCTNFENSDWTTSYSQIG